MAACQNSIISLYYLYIFHYANVPISYCSQPKYKIATQPPKPVRAENEIRIGNLEANPDNGVHYIQRPPA